MGRRLPGMPGIREWGASNSGRRCVCLETHWTGEKKKGPVRCGGGGGGEEGGGVGLRRGKCRLSKRTAL